MKAYGVIAAALAAFAIGTLHITPSLACTEGRCAEKTATAVGKPLQLTKQKSSARTAVNDSRRKKRSRIKTAPVEEKATVEQTNQSHTPAVSDTHDDPPLPVVVVRTTRESGDEQSAPVLSEEELTISIVQQRRNRFSPQRLRIISVVRTSQMISKMLRT